MNVSTPIPTADRNATGHGQLAIVDRWMFRRHVTDRLAAWEESVRRDKLAAEMARVRAVEEERIRWDVLAMYCEIETDSACVHSLDESALDRLVSEVKSMQANGLHGTYGLEQIAAGYGVDVLGRGAARAAFLMACGHVAKVARSDYAITWQSGPEWAMWDGATDAVRLLLVPFLAHGAGWSIHPRVECGRMAADQDRFWEATRKAGIGDLHGQNYGRLYGRTVVIDYGLHCGVEHANGEGAARVAGGCPTSQRLSASDTPGDCEFCGDSLDCDGDCNVCDRCEHCGRWQHGVGRGATMCAEGCGGCGGCGGVYDSSGHCGGCDECEHCEERATDVGLGGACPNGCRWCGECESWWDIDLESQCPNCREPERGECDRCEATLDMDGDCESCDRCAVCQDFGRDFGIGTHVGCRPFCEQCGTRHAPIVAAVWSGLALCMESAAVARRRSERAARGRAFRLVRDVRIAEEARVAAEHAATVARALGEALRVVLRLMAAEMAADLAPTAPRRMTDSAIVRRENEARADGRFAVPCRRCGNLVCHSEGAV